MRKMINLTTWTAEKHYWKYLCLRFSLQNNTPTKLYQLPSQKVQRVVKMQVSNDCYIHIGVMKIHVSHAKKMDHYRCHGIPMSYLRAAGQSLIINLLHFSSSEQTIIVSLFITLIFTIMKI